MKPARLDVYKGFISVVFADAQGEIVFSRTLYPRLASATDEQLRNYRFIGDGEGIHWPELNEDISIAGLVRDCEKQEMDYNEEHVMRRQLP